MIWGFYSQTFPLSLFKQSVDGQPCGCPSSVLSVHHHHRQDYAEYHGHDKNDRKHRYDKSPVHVSTLQSDLQVVSDCDDAAEGTDYDADGTYWALYVDGEPSLVGVDSLKCTDITDVEFRIAK